MYGRVTTQSNYDNLVYVRAADLKVGDRVFMPANNASRKPSEVDKNTGLGFAPVSKMRIQKLNELTPVYCLEVPGHHNFVLPSGIVSSNCHINTLLLTLFYKFLPELFERGMVYIADAPEFYSIHKGSLITGDTLSEVQTKLKKAKAPTSTTINHIKGWGEIDSDLVRILAMDPATRRLIKIQAIEKDDHVDFVRLMNDDVAYRRDMLGLPKNASGGDADGNIVPMKKVAAKKAASKKVVTKRPVRKAA
jgi:hypothetical protein